MRALTDAGTTIPLELTGSNVTRAVAALNQGRIDTGADTAFAALFGPNRRLPPDLTNYEVTITRLLTDRAWRVIYRSVAELEIDVAQSTVSVKTPAGVEWFRRRYAQETLAAVSAEFAVKQVHPLVTELLAARFPNTRPFTSTAAAANRWRIVSADRTLTMGYTPVGLTISSLAFQSGDGSVDASPGPKTTTRRRMSCSRPRG